MNQLTFSVPDKGFYGAYGGAYASESLMPILQELEAAFHNAAADPAFQAGFQSIMQTWAGRETPLYHATNLSRAWGVNVFLKREDLLHGGAHKTNNAVGQLLLAKRMGKTRVIAETGAGQHGVATAMAAALMGIPADIYMGAVDAERQAPNVQRMELLGARVIRVQSGGKTLKDAINDALRDWVASCETTHYVLGTAAGPHPFPSIVRYFQSVIGIEARRQILETTGKLPDYALACVGGGSNAIGLFSAFLDDEKVKLIGVEPGGEGENSSKHGIVLGQGVPAVLHGMRSLALQDSDGHIHETHSISAGLDYPLIGPEHAYLRDSGRVTYTHATDIEALEAFHELCSLEGIIPALESSHALAYAKKLAAQQPGTTMLINLSGRGDKDLEHVQRNQSLLQQS